MQLLPTGVSALPGLHLLGGQGSPFPVFAAAGQAAGFPLRASTPMEHPGVPPPCFRLWSFLSSVIVAFAFYYDHLLMDFL